MFDCIYCDGPCQCKLDHEEKTEQPHEQLPPLDFKVDLRKAFLQCNETKEMLEGRKENEMAMNESFTYGINPRNSKRSQESLLAGAICSVIIGGLFGGSPITQEELDALNQTMKEMPEGKPIEMKRNRWGEKTFHVLPFDDTFKHRMNPRCPCNPRVSRSGEGNTLWSHHTMKKHTLWTGLLSKILRRTGQP